MQDDGTEIDDDDILLEYATNTKNTLVLQIVDKNTCNIAMESKNDNNRKEHTPACTLYESKGMNCIKFK